MEDGESDTQACYRLYMDVVTVWKMIVGHILRIACWATVQSDHSILSVLQVSVEKSVVLSPVISTSLPI